MGNIPCVFGFLADFADPNAESPSTINNSNPSLAVPDGFAYFAGSPVITEVWYLAVTLTFSVSDFTRIFAISFNSLHTFNKS